LSDVPPFEAKRFYGTEFGFEHNELCTT